MAKSRLQKEYKKELRLLKRRIKTLQKKTGISFSPQEIEAITRGKSRPRKIDVERVRALRGDELKNRILKTTKVELPKGKIIPKVESHTVRSYVSPAQPYRKSKPTSSPKEKHERQLLTEEVKKARRNFRARVHRLEQQGYDTSRIKSAKEYTLDELGLLKGKALSEQAYKGNKTAYEIRKEKAQQKRQGTIYARKRFKEIEALIPEQEVQPIKKRELGDYEDIGKGMLTERFTQSSMIEVIGKKLEDLNKFIYGNGYLEIHYGEESETLYGLWLDILSDIDYPNDEQATNEYETYLTEHESEIMYNLELIYDPSGHGLKADDVKNCFTELISILNKGAITVQQAQTLGNIDEITNGS